MGFGRLRNIFFVVVTLLVGCATPQLTMLERAENAIIAQEWELAYRLLEDGLVSNKTEVKERVLRLVKLHPQLLPAAGQTFRLENISKTMSLHGEGVGIEIERRRLEMYKVIASKTEYETAKSNIDSLAASYDERRRKEEIAQREKEREKLQAKASLKSSLYEAAQAARFHCSSKAECEKAFSLTQIFISENADMKIQVATDTIIDTYNPTDSMKVGLKAVKMPRKGETAEITLIAACRDEGGESVKEWCDRRLLSVYRSFPKFIQEAVRP